MSLIITPKVYQIKINLKGSNPNIWRRLIVPSDMMLDEFHFVIQNAMGWENSHLYSFSQGGKLLNQSDFNYFVEKEEEGDELELRDVLKKEKDHLTYEYDFGDSWQHKVLLEKILPEIPDFRIPTCIKGKRACPPEDCGGVWRYKSMLEILKDPSNEEYEDVFEWLGDDFDPERFDIEAVNERFRF